MKDLFASIAVRMHGRIADVDLVGYPLQNIPFNGNYSQKSVALALSSTDTVASFNVKGSLNFSKEVPVIAASLVYVDMKLYEFFSHFPHKVDSNSVGFEKLVYKIRQTPNLAFTMDSISIAMSGNRFENVNGFVGIDYARLTNGVQTSRIDWLRLTAINTPTLPHQYQVHTNAFNASIKTNYNFKDLMAVVENAAHFYMPKMFISNNQFSEVKELAFADSTQFVDFDLKLFYTRNIFALILPKLDITRDAAVSIHLGSTRNDDYFNLSFPQVNFTGLGRVNNLKANGKMNENQMLGIQLQCDSVTLYQKNGNLTFSNIGINTESNREEVRFMTSWRNPQGVSVSEQNIFNGLLWESAPHDFSLKVTDSKLFLRESLWQFTGEDNIVTFGNNRFKFDHCVLTSDVGRISVNGEISRESDKDCHILLDNIDISLINSLIAKSGMTFGGDMSLIARISFQTNHFNVEGKTFVKNFAFNEELMGDLFLDAQILRDGEPHFSGGILSSNDYFNIDLAEFTHADYLSLPHKIIELNGKFLTKARELRVRADMDTLQLGFLAPFLSSFSNVITGEASGHLDFVMNPDSLYFDGTVRVKSAQMGITPLNTIYYINDQEILFNKSGINFNNVLLQDRFNNEATLSGFVNHNKFKDFRIDLNISTPRIMALNTPRRLDEPFFGDGFVSGDISIQGDTRQLNFTSRNIRTLTGSVITFPLNSTTSVSSSPGIYFIQSKEIIGTPIERTRTSSTVLNFDFTFDITRDADVRLEIDAIDGVLRCKTTGRLHLTFNSNSGNINLDGNLSIASGTFNMSLRNFFPRNFTIVEGGTISFSGPLASTQLNVRALFQRATTLTSLSSSLRNIGRTDVQAFLGLTGNLMNPSPSFTFAFPRLTDQEQIDVFTALDTANHQNGIRQFFSFVFLNTFITTADAFDPGQPAGVGIEMVSGMLSSFISNQFDNFSFGVNFINNQDNYREYSMNAQMNFLDERIILRTNLGYGEDRSQQALDNNFVGDVDLWFFLNDAKNWALRLFYFNEVNPEAMRPQQGGGVGITYRHEFNNRTDFIESWTPKKRERRQKNDNSSKSINNE
jgi:hypothetical protein